MTYLACALFIWPASLWMSQRHSGFPAAWANPSSTTIGKRKQAGRCSPCPMGLKICPLNLAALAYPCMATTSNCLTKPPAKSCWGRIKRGWWRSRAPYPLDACRPFGEMTRALSIPIGPACLENRFTPHLIGAYAMPMGTFSSLAEPTM